MYPAYPLVVLGDLHGRLDLLTAALEELRLATRDGRWTGGNRRLIQLGDVIDRGPHGLAALRYLRAIQEQARAAGGDVTLLIGNHELFALAAGAGEHGARMSWLYNGGGSGYMEWAGAGSAESDWPFPDEFYQLFAADGEFGTWMRGHQAAARHGDLLVVHAGPFGGPLDDLNADLRAVLSDPDLLRLRYRATSDPLLGLTGTFWARDFAPSAVRACLGANGTRRLIAGHTITGGIRVSQEGQLVQIDVGMTVYGSWACAALDEAGLLWGLIQGQPPQLIEEDGFLPLPVSRPAPAPPLPPARMPGDWIQLYRSSDNRYAQYFLIEAIRPFYGHAHYQGLFIRREDNRVESRQALWPADRIDRLGRIIEPDPLLRSQVEGQLAD